MQLSCLEKRRQSVLLYGGVGHCNPNILLSMYNFATIWFCQMTIWMKSSVHATKDGFTNLAFAICT